MLLSSRKLFTIILNLSVAILYYAPTSAEQGHIKILQDVPKLDKRSLQNEDDSVVFQKLASFSGPDHFKEILDSCFIYIDNKYKYKFCPFSNVTQEEFGSLQDTYKGVLGVWGEWIITSNNFNKMHYILGSKCGLGMRRSILIDIKCGPDNKFSSVKEPKKCQYVGEFFTPLSCGLNALTVYPRLPNPLQEKWDVIETEKNFNMLTEKGYHNELDRIFVAAGYRLSEEEKNKFLTEQNNGGSCEAKLESLQLKISALERQLESKQQVVKKIISNVKDKSSGNSTKNVDQISVHLSPPDK